jgi:DNA-binding response OmpR family regulator
MEDRTWTDKQRTSLQWTEAEMEALARPSILLVEDDGDIRDLLETLLHIAGFQVESCGTAEAALEHLRESPFDLVLTDYGLPHRSGGWLLKQASQEGLLDTTPALVVTAHPTPADTEGFEIIQKPFDLDELVGHVRRRLTGERPPQRKPRAAARVSGKPADDGTTDCPDPIELILYVSPQSPRSASAIANIKAVLSKFHSSRVSLTICDLSTDPMGGKEDAVAFTPTLVKRSPGPRTFIIGHLTNPDVLLELLEGCEQS